MAPLVSIIQFSVTACSRAHHSIVDVWSIEIFIRELAAAASLISSGDLTQAVTIDGTDETAELAKSFSTMLANLLSVLTGVESGATQLHNSALTLSRTTEEVNAATAGIAEAAQAIARGADAQADDVSRTSALTRVIWKLIPDHFC